MTPPIEEEITPAEETPQASGNLKAHPSLVALTIACYDELAAEYAGGSFPPFPELKEVTQQNYVDAAAHVLSNNQARTRFEELVLKTLNFSA